MAIVAFIGKRPVLDESNFIAPSADVIGDVTLGRETSIWFHATVRADVHWIRIGPQSNVQDNVVIHVTQGKAPTEVGALVTIGHGAILHGCTVRDRVLVGTGAVVMDHAEVGEDSIIGARALVTQGMKIPPRSLVLGSPARVVRPLEEEEVAGIVVYARKYLRYGAIYRGVERPDTNPFY